MHKDTVYGEVNLRREKTLPLKDVLNNPSIVVDKSLKSKLHELLKAQYDLKAITKYFEAHQDVWADINLKKIKVYYFTKETNERFLQHVSHWIQALIRKRFKRKLQIQVYKGFCYVICS